MRYPSSNEDNEGRFWLSLLISLFHLDYSPHFLRVSVTGIDCPVMPRQRPKFLASASKILPRPRSRSFGIGLSLKHLASISLSYYLIGHFSGKNRVKFRNFLIFPAIILNHMLLIIIWYFFHNFLALALASISRYWPRPRPRSSGLSLEVLALFHLPCLTVCVN